MQEFEGRSRRKVLIERKGKETELKRKGEQKKGGRKEGVEDRKRQRAREREACVQQLCEMIFSCQLSCN